MERSRTLARTASATSAAPTGASVPTRNGGGRFTQPDPTPSVFDDDKLNEDANLADYPCYLPNVDVVSRSSSASSAPPSSIFVRDDFSAPYSDDRYLGMASSFDEDPCSSTAIYESTWPCEGGAVPAVSSASLVNSSPSHLRSNHNSRLPNQHQAVPRRNSLPARAQVKPPPRLVKREEQPVDEEQARSISETVDQVVQKLRSAPRPPPPPSPPQQLQQQTIVTVDPHPQQQQLLSGRKQADWRQRARARLRARHVPDHLGDDGVDDVEEELIEDGMEEAELEKALHEVVPIPTKKRRFVSIEVREMKKEIDEEQEDEGEEGVSALDLIGSNDVKEEVDSEEENLEDGQEGIQATDLIDGIPATELINETEDDFKEEVDEEDDDEEEELPMTKSPSPTTSSTHFEPIPLKSHTTNRESSYREPCSVFGDEQLEAKFKLIKLVEERRNLWHADILVPYRSALFEKLWTEVAAGVGQSKPWCLKFWQILRQVLRQRKTRKSKDTRVFHFEKAIAFYKDFADSTAGNSKQQRKTQWMFNLDQQLALIEAIKARSALWPGASRTGYASKALWIEVAKELKLDPEQCKQEFRSMRRNVAEQRQALEKDPTSEKLLPYTEALRLFEEAKDNQEDETEVDQSTEQRKQEKEVEKRRSSAARPKLWASGSKTSNESVKKRPAMPIRMIPVESKRVKIEPPEDEKPGTSASLQTDFAVKELSWAEGQTVKAEPAEVDEHDEEDLFREFFIPNSELPRPPKLPQMNLQSLQPQRPKTERAVPVINQFKVSPTRPIVIDARNLGTKPMPRVPEMNLSDMKVHQQALQLIQARPVLWDPTKKRDPDYGLAWLEVAKALGRSDRWAHQFWVDVRTRYHLHLTKKARDPREWWHLEDAMAFYNKIAEEMRRSAELKNRQGPTFRTVARPSVPYLRSASASSSRIPIIRKKP